MLSVKCYDYGTVINTWTQCLSIILMEQVSPFYKSEPRQIFISPDMSDIQSCAFGDQNNSTLGKVGTWQVQLIPGTYNLQVTRNDPYAQS